MGSLVVPTCPGRGRLPTEGPSRRSRLVGGTRESVETGMEIVCVCVTVGTRSSVGLRKRR